MISMSKSQAFNTFPVMNMEKIDDKVLKSLQKEGLLQSQDDKLARERQLEEKFGNLNRILKPRFMRGKDGKKFRVYTETDATTIDGDNKNNYNLFPTNPDIQDREMDYVKVLQSAVQQSENTRNKYMPKK